MALGGGVEIVAATRGVELEMIRRALQRHGALERLLASTERDSTGDVRIPFEAAGPLRVRDLAARPIAPRANGSPLLLFFHSLYPDAVSSYLAGEPCPEPEQAAEAIAALLPRFAPARARFLLLNVFRHVSPSPQGPPSDAPALRDRIRRFNREALRMAVAGQIVLVDVDDAMAREGARALRCDHSCESELAIDRGARKVAEVVLSLDLAPAAGDGG